MPALNPEVMRALGGVDDVALALARSGRAPSAHMGYQQRRGNKQKTDGWEEAAHEAEIAEAYNQWFNMRFILPLGMGLPLGAGALQWIGSKTGLKPLESAGKYGSKIGHMRFEQIGNHTPGIVNHAAGGMLHFASTALSPIGDIAHWLGITGHIAKSYEKKFQAHLPKVEEHLNQLKAVDVSAHPELQAVLRDAQEIHAHGPAEWWRLHILETEMGERLAATAKSGKAGQQAAKAFEDAFRPFSNVAQDAGMAHSMMHGYANPGRAMRSGQVVDYAKGGMVVHSLMNASFVASSVIGHVLFARDLHKDMKALYQLAADAKNQEAEAHHVSHGNAPARKIRLEDVDFVGIFLGKYGKLPAQLAMGLMKKYGPSLVMDVANTFVNTKMLLHNRLFNGFLGMGAIIGLPIASGMWRAMMGSEALPVYAALKEAQGQGKQLAAGDYAKFIGESCEELRKRGGEESHFTQALAAQYAQKHVAIEQVMREVNDGTLMKRVNAMHKQYEAAHKNDPKPAPQEKSAAAPAQHTQPEAAHPAPAPKEYKVYGKHSAKEVQKIHTAALAPKGGMALGEART